MSDTQIRFMPITEFKESREGLDREQLIEEIHELRCLLGRFMPVKMSDQSVFHDKPQMLLTEMLTVCKEVYPDFDSLTAAEGFFGEGYSHAKFLSAFAFDALCLAVHNSVSLGIIPRITTHPLKPLAMGNYTLQLDVNACNAAYRQPNFVSGSST